MLESAMHKKLDIKIEINMNYLSSTHSGIISIG